jgi:hypothetical protein
MPPYKQCSLSENFVSSNCSVAMPEVFTASILRFLAFWDYKFWCGHSIIYPSFSEEKDAFKNVRLWRFTRYTVYRCM